MTYRSILKAPLALLWATSLLMTCAALSGCGSGGGLSGDDQEPDPATVEYPIAYIQRPTPDQDDPQTEDDDLQNPFAFTPGAKLFVRSRADSNAEEINVTDALVGADETDLYDVKDLAVSPDGENLVFAFHKPLLENADPIDQESWDIYIYNFATRTARPVIPNKNKSEGSDVAPHFLADGRIVFVSDRQQRTREQLTNMGSPAYSGLAESGNVKAGVLHIMNADGSGIAQISFNQSHDLSPAQLRNGKLVFVRWDNMPNASQRNMNIYSLNPSGMNLSYLYGYRSHTGTNNETVQFSMPREMEDGRIAAILRRDQTANRGGDLIAIDVEHFSDNNQPTWENAGLTGPAQQSLAANPVSLDDDVLSPGGHFGAVWPLFDGTGRLLISWSQCRYLDDNDVIRPCTSSTPADADPAPLLYGLWIFDPDAQTQRPIVTPREGVIYTDIVAASPAKTIVEARDNTPANNSIDLTDYGSNIASTLATNNTAVLDIRSVYNFDDTVGNYGFAVPDNMLATQVIPASATNSLYQTRKARFLQIVQGVPLPDRNDEIPAGNNQVLNVPAFAGNYLRHIVGYVPIEADGSVVVQVPADVPITFNVLDENARRLNGGGNHPVWMQFRAGEVIRCTGCHDASTTATQTLTHGRADSSAPDSNPGTANSGFFAGTSASSVNFQALRPGQSIAEVYSANKQKPRVPSLNVYFQDEWATVVNERNPVLDYRYINADLARPLQVPVPPVTSQSCLELVSTPLVPRWNSSCRIIINYLEHIQPIWDKLRLFNADDGTAFGTDNKCTSCHSATDAMGAAQVPKGQLNLTDGASDRDNNRVMSHSELFDTGNSDVVRDAAGTPVQQVIGGVPQVDAEGNPVFTDINRTMVAGSAQASYFFTCFSGTGLTCREQKDANAPLTSPFVNHVGMLTKAELRLLSEWLDNGAQYYNDVAKAAAAQ